MLIGYNNDVQYRGKTFHIQTEDRGLPAKEIETQIFHAGAILDTRILSYEEVYDAEEDKEARNASIKTLMQNTHRELYKNLFAGKYDQFAGLPAKDASEVSEVVPPAIEEFTPSQERVPAAALEVEQKGAEAFQVKSEDDHVDLKSLKARLAQMSSTGSDSEDEYDEPPTQVVEPPSEAQILPDFGARPAPASLAGLNPNIKKGNVRASLPSIATKSPPTSGKSAWSGAYPPTEDLQITELVEAYLAKQ